MSHYLPDQQEIEYLHTALLEARKEEADLRAQLAAAQAETRELEELIGLASTSFSMLEAYLGPQWFEAVSNMELVGPDKVHASAARAKKEVER